jgi:hypothetical protein
MSVASSQDTSQMCIEWAHSNLAQASHPIATFPWLPSGCIPVWLRTDHDNCLQVQGIHSCSLHFGHHIITVYCYSGNLGPAKQSSVPPHRNWIDLTVGNVVGVWRSCLPNVADTRRIDSRNISLEYVQMKKPGLLPLIQSYSKHFHLHWSVCCSTRLALKYLITSWL